MGVKRTFAYLAYTLGTILALKTFLGGLSDDNPVGWLLGLTGIAAWWIGAGVGIRLGVTPREFLRGVVRFLDLDEPGDGEPASAVEPHRTQS